MHIFTKCIKIITSRPVWHTELYLKNTTVGYTANTEDWPVRLFSWLCYETIKKKTLYVMGEVWIERWPFRWQAHLSQQLFVQKANKFSTVSASNWAGGGCVHRFFSTFNDSSSKFFSWPSTTSLGDRMSVFNCVMSFHFNSCEAPAVHHRFRLD